jgi:DNA invertase Pin-like site-specific DNA recombinase
VDLRGRLSNPEAVETVALATQAIAGVKIHHGSTASRPVARRRWQLVDRLGEQIISDLIRDSGMGATQRTLAERYGISLSSVKRLTRRPRSDSLEPAIRWEAGRNTRKGRANSG